MVLKSKSSDKRKMGVLLSRIKISVNTDISVIGFYENIGNIGGNFYKNIGLIKIFHILII